MFPSRPSLPACLSPALPVNNTHVQNVFSSLLGRLSLEQKRTLEECFDSSGAPERIGTVCSGSDAPMLAIRGLRDVASGESKTVFMYDHVFSSECEKPKQEFILANASPRALFDDTRSLSKSSAFDVVTKSWKKVDECDWLIGGFPCTDLSRLNPHHSDGQNKECISASSLSTGSVFRGILDFVAQHKVKKTLIFENVPAICDRSKEVDGCSNYEVCVRSLRDIGWIVHAFFVDPCYLFGIPQHRERVYIIAVPADLLKTKGICEDQFHVLCDGFMAGCVGWGKQSVDDYLLPEDPSRNITALPHKDKLHDTKGASRWIDVISKACSKNKVDFLSTDAPDAQALRLFPSLRQLGPREWKYLRLAGVTSYPEASTRIVELKHNFSCGQVIRPGYCSSITPGGRKYVSSRCRFLFAEEALRFQNIWLHKASAWNSNLLYSLAGNSFEVTSFCSVFLVACLLHAHVSDFPQQIPRAVPEVDPDTVVEADETDPVLVLSSVWGQRLKRDFVLWEPSKRRR